jgi:peptidoglycan/LPS O-acetylase OafA/YrhL
LSIAALILHLSNDPNSKFSAFLKLPFSQYLGKISFSFYLWNVIALNLFIPLARVPSIAQHPLEFGLLIGFVTFLLTLPMAHYSEQFIEQPAIRLGKMLSERVLLIPFQIRMAIANE